MYTCQKHNHDNCLDDFNNIRETDEFCINITSITMKYLVIV